MRTTYRVAFWALAGWLSTVALAQEPASSSAAQDGAAVASEASQPDVSKKAQRGADRSFARKVHQALNKTKGLEGADIAVFANSRTGEVILAGFIDRQDQENIATEAAGKIPGVKSVTSKVVLRPQL
ncbi:BON domain-containing protein [Caballeronia sp. SEWSISQ10-4 2]|uniref:BON domain-containing protein n=1 Tax=Caballeronia sp. SEWSISQ10-4 2 TaxID=2937438 RepID=UPI00264D305F|nr:BON domain-containing protein [Caballeronia sp. SEWSISQ10-4 2]MDN7184473.1 BON domain-containing protein [Caballeronia sp. SEWSISQ10-4 2]